MSFSKRVIFLPSLDLLSNPFSSIPEMIFPEKKKKKKEENQHRLFILLLVRKVVKNGSINSKDDLTRRQQLSTTILYVCTCVPLFFSSLS